MTAELSRTLSYQQIEVGQPLPELVIELTPTVIISTAIASRDYQDVHHDRDLAQGDKHNRAMSSASCNASPLAAR